MSRVSLDARTWWRAWNYNNFPAEARSNVDLTVVLLLLSASNLGRVTRHYVDFFPFIPLTFFLLFLQFNRFIKSIVLMNELLRHSNTGLSREGDESSEWFIGIVGFVESIGEENASRKNWLIWLLESRHGYQRIRKIFSMRKKLSLQDNFEDWIFLNLS